MKKRMLCLLLALALAAGLTSPGAFGTRAAATMMPTYTYYGTHNAAVTIGNGEKFVSAATASGAGFYNAPAEMVSASNQTFRLVCCDDGTYAFQSSVNKSYLTLMASQKEQTAAEGLPASIFDSDVRYFAFCSAFIDGAKTKFRLVQADPENGGYKDAQFESSNSGASTVCCFLKSEGSGQMIGVNENGWLFATDKASEARVFYVTTVGVNDTSWDLDIIHNAGWFNLQKDGVSMHMGYWEFQDDLGTGSTYAMQQLGYTMMTWNGKSPITIGNMECAIGVKADKTSGVYDVTIVFQGTAGYDGGNPLDSLEDVFSNLNNSIEDDQHAGYRAMAYKLINERFNVSANVGGKKVTLESLIRGASSDGSALFTLVGHSMGGAIAQCFGLYLARERGIAPQDIRGRTFESALALAAGSGDKNSDVYYASFDDWYNVCVNSDSVPNGTVPHSILESSGEHRLGKTVWLNDPNPDKDFNYLYPKSIQLALGKHDMKGVLERLLRAHVDHKKADQTYWKVCKNGDLIDCPFAEEYKKSTVAGERFFVTVASNTVVYAEPTVTSSVSSTIANAQTSVNATEYTYDRAGNKFYFITGSTEASESGGWVRREDLASKDMKPKLEQGTFVMNLWAVRNTDVRQTPDRTAAVLGEVKLADRVTASIDVKNTAGEIWLHLEDREGWVPLENFFPMSIADGAKYIRAIVMCPVNVDVLNEQGTVVLSIENDAVTKNDAPDELHPMLIGDEKLLYIADDGKKWTLRFTATDSDTLSYAAQTFDPAAQTYTAGQTFDYVALTPGKVLSTEVGGTGEAAGLLVLSGGVPVSSVASDGTETPLGGSGSSHGGSAETAEKPAWVNPFSDVRADAWYYGGVAYVGESGLMKGVSGTVFSPDGALTRGMLVSVLWRMAGSPEAAGESGFADVAPGAYYARAVAWAAANKIVTGYSPSAFGPDDPVTREQLAAILYRYAQYKKIDVSVGEETNILSYDDALTISEYAIPAVQWACGADLLRGSGNKLTPRDGATRAQAAELLLRFSRLGA